MPQENLIDRCRALGMRLTEQRLAICRVLEVAEDHPDAEEVHRRVLKTAPGTNLATVYRTINKLTEAGLLERHSFAAGRQKFERMPEHHHDHFIDADTGAVYEFYSAEIEKLQAQIARQHGFEIVHHRLEIFVRPLKR